ncbi:MAG: beta-hydroxyacyl-ACP dehydratase [Halobacteriovoraceae bacterium]|jgi:3-hydroxyacyl-[acyl-carrier-protein] dehydratase|nr:beta-hydroxyacyl-ACP dehydratase [Halobacteriovoraceae bacterium]
MRFYLLDRVTQIDLGHTISGLKCWSMTEEYLEQHFPGFPVIPGVLVTESMAQLLGILIEKTYHKNYPNTDGVYAVLTIIHKAKFKKFLIPGDQARLEAKMTSIDKNMASGTVKVYVGDELFNQAELTFGLIPKTNLPNDRLAKMREEYFDVLFNAKSVRDNLGSTGR